MFRVIKWSRNVPGTIGTPQTIGTPECTNPLEEARVFRRLCKQASSVSQFILATSKSRFDLHWRKGFYCSSALTQSVYVSHRHGPWYLPIRVFNPFACPTWIMSESIVQFVLAPCLLTKLTRFSPTIVTTCSCLARLSMLIEMYVYFCEDRRWDNNSLLLKVLRYVS